MPPITSAARQSPNFFMEVETNMPSVAGISIYFCDFSSWGGVTTMHFQ